MRTEDVRPGKIEVRFWNYHQFLLETSSLLQSANKSVVRAYILDALRITRIYKDEMPLEHARCLHLLADLSNFESVGSNDYNLAYEVRLAANKEILDHASREQSGSTDIRRSALENRFDKEEFEKALTDKVFYLWR